MDLVNRPRELARLARFMGLVDNRGRNWWPRLIVKFHIVKG